MGHAPRPPFTITGRSPDALLRDIRRWHRQLNRRRMTRGVSSWPGCGIAGHEPVKQDGSPASGIITELTATTALDAEGATLEHCVVTYARRCASHDCAIFSLRRHFEDQDRVVSVVTIEVSLQDRTIVQARGHHNSPPTPCDRKVIEMWAGDVGLQILPYVFK